MAIKLQAIGVRAEHEGIYCIDSQCRGTMYLYADGEYAIVQPNGFLRMNENTLDVMIDELIGIRADIDILKKCERR